MTTYYTENFDSASTGFMPSGWSSYLTGTSPSCGAQSTYSRSGAQSIRMYGTGSHIYCWKTSLNDSNNGNTWLEGYYYCPTLPTGQYAGPEFCLRTQAAPASQTFPPTSFRCGMDISSHASNYGVYLQYQPTPVAGGTQLAQWNPTNGNSLFASGVWYRFIVTVRDVISNLTLGSTFQNDGTQIEFAMYIQRMSDNYWLVNSGTTGTWTDTGVMTCVFKYYWVDTNWPTRSWWGAGLATIGAYCVGGSGFPFYLDDATWKDYPAPPSITSLTWSPGASVELQGTYTGVDTGSPTIGSISDGDFDTAYVSTATQETWAMLDLGSGKTATPTAILFAPQSDNGNEYSAPYMQIEGATSSGGPWTTLGQNPAEAWSRYNLIRVPFSAGAAYRYFRLRHMTDIMRCAEFRVEGVLNGAGSPTWQPVRPTLTPPAGKYANGSTVAITTPTSGASIYYTVDGSTPTTGSTLYTGPVMLPSNTYRPGTTIKAIAYHASGTTTTSPVVSGYFVTPQEFVPDTGATAFSSTENWPETIYDDRGWLIPLAYPTLFWDSSNSTYYMWGESYNTYNDATTYYWTPRGFPIYSSTDLYNWTYVATIPPTPANGSWRVASSTNWYGRFVRLHIFRNPSPVDSNKRYVGWARGDWVRSGNPPCCTAPAITGPWTWQGMTLPPSATNTQDCSLFADSNGDVWYVYNNNNAAIKASKLDSATDYTSFVGGSAITLNSTVNREAPVVIQYGGSYYLICSKLENYIATQSDMKYVAATGSTLDGVASTLNAATLASIWSSGPTNHTVAYNAQSVSVIPVRGRKGFLFGFGFMACGDPASQVYHGRPVFYPAPWSSITTGGSPALSLTIPTSWSIDANIPGITTITPAAYPNIPNAILAM